MEIYEKLYQTRQRHLKPLEDCQIDSQNFKESQSSHPKNLALLKDGVFTDYAIVCDGVKFRVHKSHLYPASEFFQQCLNGSFK